MQHPPVFFVHDRRLDGAGPLPDGGEGLAKRKSVAARQGLKEARSKAATRWTRTGYEAYPAGRAGKCSRSPQPSRASVVNPAGVR